MYTLVSLLKLYNYSVKTACSEADRSDFLVGLQNMLRLLCVLTYDSKVASLLMNDEIELVQEKIRRQKNGEAPLQKADESAVLLLSTLHEVLTDLGDSPATALLVLNVIRNVSCCSGRRTGE